MTLKIDDAVLELFQNDLWKDARKLKLAECDNKTAITRYTDQDSSVTDEVNFLSYLRNHISFKIPSIIHHTDSYIVFDYIEGTRAFNLLIDLFEINKSKKSKSLFTIAETLISVLSDHLKEFQSLFKTRNLRSQELKPYPAEKKLLNLYRVLGQVLSLEIDEDSITKISQNYQASCTIPFRDATPKNIILNIPELHQGRFKSRKDRLTKVASLTNSGQLLNSISSDSIYHIDFTGCRHLCPISDDWVALHHHQSSGWIDPKMRILEKYNSISDLCTVFVRYSRFAGRKLAYRLLNKNGHRIRFGFDNEATYFETLAKICQRLQEMEFLTNSKLKNLMVELKTATSFSPDVDYFHRWKKSTESFAYYTDVFPN